MTPVSLLSMYIYKIEHIYEYCLFCRFNLSG